MLAPSLAYSSQIVGALFSKTMGSEMTDLPTDAEIRGWLSFIEIQCPECFPPEPWPGD